MILRMIFGMPEEYLRKVSESDIKLLYQWANDPETRANAFDSTPISFESHKNWFKQKLIAPNVLFFIYHYDGKDIGQVRLDIKDDTVIIDYSIAFAFRGKGHGYRMMYLAEKKARDEYPEIKWFQAQVKYKNNASLNIFRRLNYTEYREANLIRFVKTLPPPPDKNTTN
jgi:RimJ/RimL family protein N-acetyltransferase